MKQENTTTRKLEELLYKKIITADGKMIGHVFDIQLSRDGEHRGWRTSCYSTYVWKEQPALPLAYI